MQHLKTWFLRSSVLAIYGLVALFAAAIGPVVARAQTSCPPVTVRCPDGRTLKTCSGTLQGGYC